MEEALNTFEFPRHDEQTRLRYEARQKALHDYATAIETATRQGRQEGHMEERRAIARRLLLKWLSVEGTAAIANRTFSEVEMIANTIQ